MARFRSVRRNPWWIPPFLGGVPEVEAPLVTVLGLVSLALFFEQYDNSMLTSALKFIAADLGMTEAELGPFLALIRLGALPAFLVVPLADRIGRRRVFLAAVLGCSVGTFLTAFAADAVQFVAIQMLTRTFLLAGAAVSIVIVTEEYPAEHRGWALGILGALSACGHGLGAGLFAAVEFLPYGWRALYVVGAAPLLLLPVFARHVAETGRFHRHSRVRDREDRSRAGGWLGPVASFARTHPGRALGISLAAGLFAMGEASVFQFTGYFTQTVHGWSPGEFSLMFIVGGAVGIVGNVFAGRLGDTIGRRAVGTTFILLFPLFAGLFYQGPGWCLPIAWALFIFCTTATGVILRALSTELFPTSHRGTAAAWVSLVQTVGWAAGLALVGLGTRSGRDIATMTSLVSLAVLGAAVALLALPETSQKELEALSGEEAESLELAPLTSSGREAGGA